MAYVRYKLPDETHSILKDLSKNLGLKESEISRIAIMEYLKSVGVITENVRKKKLIKWGK